MVTKPEVHGVTGSLNDQLRALHEERERSWAPAALKINVDQRRILVEQAAEARFPRVGDRIAPFSLANVTGGDLTLDDLLRDGPAVLIFFRFATCPACNIALPYYESALWPQLQRMGAKLVAVSPQVPDRLSEIKTTHRLGFHVATDRGNALGRRLGILYEYDQASKDASLASGKFIGDVTGTGTWELPQPTVLVIDQDCIIRFAEVSPDWLVRTEAEPILDAVRSVVLDQAA